MKKKNHLKIEYNILPVRSETIKLLETKQDHFFAVISCMQYQKDGQNITYKFDKL